MRGKSKPPPVSVCVLTYGDYPHLARRCIESIRRYCDLSRYRLIVGANAVGAETASYLRGLDRAGAIDRLLFSRKNLNKCPMMRRMFAHVDTQFIWWFDDDAYLTHRLHFLHATIHPVRVQTKLGSYLVRYEGASSESIPILYGRQVTAWQPDARDTVQSADTRVGWKSAEPSPASARRPCVLYHTQWDNPLPEVRIESLDLRSAGTGSGPFLVAVTVEP